MKCSYYELSFEETEDGMCILGIRKPTPEEASDFVKTAFEYFNPEDYFGTEKVTEVKELTQDEAHARFDMDEDSVPVFGVKYFELVFDNEDEGMCILGIRKPTAEEATAFIHHDLENCYESTKVVVVEELSRNQAIALFDMDNERDMPVFGVQ